MFDTTKIAPVAMAGLMLTFISMSLMASDRSIRCGTHLIYAGGGNDNSGMYEVLKKCGEPEAKNGDTWIYVQGGMRRILTFSYDGRLARIESRRN